MTPFIARIMRNINAIRRPSKNANRRRLAKRNENISSFIFREPVIEDLEELVELHITTWNATYPLVKTKPTKDIRTFQWKKYFEVTDGSRFCFLIENNDGKLIGFAQANNYNEIPGFEGQLNKIYLLRDYQRLGLGKKLMQFVAARFLSRGISSMVLFAEPDNPSCHFYESLHGERVLSENGEFNGGYGWRDLRVVLSS